MLQTSSSTSIGGGARQVKKLVIKNFKGQRIPEDFESNAWNALQSGLQAIFSGKQDTISLEVLYRTNFGRTSASGQSSDCSTLLLKDINEVWKEFTDQIRTVCNVFLYLDRVFVINRPELLSIWDMAMVQFRTNAFGDPSIRPALIISALLKTVKKDREDEISKVSILISNIIDMLTSLKLMEDWATKEFLQDTVEFFDAESVSKLNSLSIPSYLEYARHRIDDEATRFTNYALEASFKSELLQSVRNSIFVAHLDAILEKGLEEMIKGDNQTILTLLYNLCQETHCLERLGIAWSLLIRKAGSLLVGGGASGKDEIVIGELIDFKDKLDRIVKSSFGENILFADAEKDAFESFMNSRQNRPAELIAKYADYQLRGGPGEVLNDQQIEPILDKIIILFRFLQGKDYFESVYKKDLSRRLLFNRSITMEAEKAFVGRLKQECGSAFTSKLEGMFKDMELSKESMIAYHGQGKKSDFASTTVASGLWPYPPLVSANIPSSIVKEQEEFEAFYKAQHKGRVLNWHQGLGNCIIRASFPLGSKELQLSIPQTLILLCFNDAADRSFQEIQNSTGLEDVTLIRALQSLACGKVNVLLKKPKGRDIAPSDLFSFNGEFTSKHNRIRINALSDREVGEEHIVSPSEGPSDRQYQIDAAIVRLLKTNKRLEKRQLIAMASEQLKYELAMDEFMRRSQSLIDREFIGQDPDELSVYIYVA